MHYLQGHLPIKSNKSKNQKKDFQAKETSNHPATT